MIVGLYTVVNHLTQTNHGGEAVFTFVVSRLPQSLPTVLQNFVPVPTRKEKKLQTASTQALRHVSCRHASATSGDHGTDGKFRRGRGKVALLSKVRVNTRDDELALGVFCDSVTGRSDLSVASIGHFFVEAAEVAGPAEFKVSRSRSGFTFVDDSLVCVVGTPTAFPLDLSFAAFK